MSFTSPGDYFGASERWSGQIINIKHIITHIDESQVLKGNSAPDFEPYHRTRDYTTKGTKLIPEEIYIFMMAQTHCRSCPRTPIGTNLYIENASCGVARQAHRNVSPPIADDITGRIVPFFAHKNFRASVAIIASSSYVFSVEEK